MEQSLKTVRNILQLWFDDTHDEEDALFFKTYMDLIDQTNSIDGFVSSLTKEQADNFLYAFLKDEIKHAEEEDDFIRSSHLEQVALLVSLHHQFISMN